MKVFPDNFYKSSDLNSEGKIPVIIQSKDKKFFQELQTKLKPSYCEITGELKIIDSFTANIHPEKFKEFVKLLPKNANLFLDSKVSIPENPEIINEEPPSVTPKTNTAMPVSGVNKLWEKGFTGKGVTIAVVDTGIYDHPDLKDLNTGKSRIIGFKDFIDNKEQPYDDQGHGTHVSGIAAGNGLSSQGVFKGAAPEANLVGVKVLKANGQGSYSGIIRGIEWVVNNKNKYNIKVMNMSLGGDINTSYKKDPLVQAVEKDFSKGIVPVIAAGNSGPNNSTIGSPGNAPSVITVGALNDNQTVDKSDDLIAKFSSRGPTSIDKLNKPDVLFSGVNITSCLSPGSAMDNPNIPHIGKDYITISGTSMATPGTAGVIADLIQANPRIKPVQIKKILMETSDPLDGLTVNDQGKGLVDAPEALTKVI